MRCFFLLSTLGLVLFLLAACTRAYGPEDPFEALAGRSYFVRKVKPVLETRCVGCHRGKQPPAGLSLVQRSALYGPRKLDRAFVVPGDPYASRLLTVVAEGGRHSRMASAEPLLTGPQVDIIYEWIEDGAHWPDNPAGFLQPRTEMPRKGLLERR